MRNKFSGSIYRFPLNFELGFSYCELLDHTDIADFDGRLIYVYNRINKEKLPEYNLSEILSSKKLFGPVPIYKYPNVKGKGAWKLIGKNSKITEKFPVMKSVQDNYTKPDWTKIGPWFKLYERNERGKNVSYEEVRYLEIPILNDMRAIEIRTTMHFLLIDKKDLRDYYDLTDDNFKFICITVLNSSFDKKTASKYLRQFKFV